MMTAHSSNAFSSPQQELFKADTTWFHVFKGMIDNGDVAKLGPYATTTYLVIKAHTNFGTGQAFPAVGTIAKKAGISERKVKECLQTLEEYGYIIKDRQGRSNRYTLREKIHIQNNEGQSVATAAFDYLPKQVERARADVQNVVFTGDLDAAEIVHIERLVMNVQIIQGGVNTINQMNLGDAISSLEQIKDPHLHETMSRLLETVTRKHEVVDN